MTPIDILSRRSVRKYTTDSVGDDQIRIALEAPMNWKEWATIWLTSLKIWKERLSRIYNL